MINKSWAYNVVHVGQVVNEYGVVVVAVYDKELLPTIMQACEQYRQSRKDVEDVVRRANESEAKRAAAREEWYNEHDKDGC